MNDPVIFKVLAVMQATMWASFLVRYVRVLRRNGTLHTPGWHPREAVRRVFSGQSILAKFAGAVLMIGTAMVLFAMATVLRQFLGMDYWGRDAVRITASSMFLVSGLIFHLVLSREKHTERPLRRSTDLH